MDPTGIPANPAKVDPAEDMAEKRETIDRGKINKTIAIFFIMTPK